MMQFMLGLQQQTEMKTKEAQKQRDYEAKVAQQAREEAQQEREDKLRREQILREDQQKREQAQIVREEQQEARLILATQKMKEMMDENEQRRLNEEHGFRKLEREKAEARQSKADFRQQSQAFSSIKRSLTQRSWKPCSKHLRSWENSTWYPKKDGLCC